MIADVLVWWPWMLTMNIDARYSKVSENASSKDGLKSILHLAPTLFGKVTDL
jgi:hypothetical protein